MGVEADLMAASKVHGARPTLLLINGAPGVGKSTIGQRLLAVHPEARCVEVDRLRMQIEGWQDDESTKLTARDLALAAVEESLAEGRDVIVPQFVGRPDFVDRLAAAATVAGAAFVHVVLSAGPPVLAERFEQRRAELSATARRHPEAEVDDIAPALADAVAMLDALAEVRPVVGLSADGSADGLVERLGELLGG